MQQTHTSDNSAATAAARGAACASLALGMVVLAGWWLDLPLLRSLRPGWPSLTVNGALVFVLLGLSLESKLQRPSPGWGAHLFHLVGQAAALGVAVIGILTLVEYLFGRNVGIDEWLLKDTRAAYRGAIPGRLSFPTALSATSLGLGLLLLDVNFRRVWLSQTMAVTSVLIAFLALIGHACNVPEFYGRMSSHRGTGMSVQAVAGFLVMGVGLLCARAERGLMSVLWSHTPGGVLARWLMLAPALGLLLTGVVYMLLSQGIRVDHAIRTWALGLSNLVFVTVPIWAAAHALHGTGLERDQAHQALEQRVQQRTSQFSQVNEALEQEIAERKQVEQALRDRERELRLVMDAGPTLIAYVNSQRCYHRVNQSYADWYGVSREIVRGRPVEEIVGRDVWRIMEPYVARALMGEVVSYEHELPLRTGPRWIRATYTPDRDVSLIVRGFVVHALDITERKGAEDAVRVARDRLEAQAAELERRVTERTAKLQETIGDLESFSYSVAHDMRAPLRGMQGFARLLLEEHASRLDGEARSYLDRIASSASRMDLLIQDALNYTKILRTETSIQAVDIERLVRQLVTIYPGWQPPQVDIQILGTFPLVMGHEGFLTQCMSNLIGNAVKFVPPGTRPQVRIWAERMSGRVRVYVEDNGIGIDPKDHERIFCMFERLNRASQYEGTGVGLAIARKAAERLGGRIDFESELGKGTRFWIELKEASLA